MVVEDKPHLDDAATAAPPDAEMDKLGLHDGLEKGGHIFLQKCDKRVQRQQKQYAYNQLNFVNFRMF